MADTVHAHRPAYANVLDHANRHAHWLLRLGLAAVFLYHGLTKLGDPRGFAAMMGLPAGMGIWVALAEVGAAAFLVAGGLPLRYAQEATRVGAALAVLVMVGAISIAHWPQWNFVPSETHPMGGMEFQVVLALTAAYLLVKGDDA